MRDCGGRLVEHAAVDSVTPLWGLISHREKRSIEVPITVLATRSSSLSCLSRAMRPKRNVRSCTACAPPRRRQHAACWLFRTLRRFLPAVCLAIDGVGLLVLFVDTRGDPER